MEFLNEMERLAKYVDQEIIDVEQAYRLVEKIRGDFPVSYKRPLALTRQAKWNEILSFMQKNPAVLSQVLPISKDVIKHKKQLNRSSSDKKHGSSDKKRGMLESTLSHDRLPDLVIGQSNFASVSGEKAVNTSRNIVGGYESRTNLNEVDEETYISSDTNKHPSTHRN